MATPRKNIIYTATDLQRYHSGSMSEAEMHALEKAALEDPFLSDALDGYSFTETAEKDIIELKNKILEKKERKKIFPLLSIKNISWWKVAAILVIITGTVYLANNFNQSTDRSPLAKNKEQDNIQIEKRVDSISQDRKQPESISQNNGSLKIDTNKIAVNQPVLQVMPGKNRPVKKLTVSATSTYTYASAAPVTADEAGTDTAFANAKDKPVTLEKSSIDVNRAEGMVTRRPVKFEFTGRVVDDHGKTVPFANINGIDKKINFGTDASGKFSIVMNDSIMPATIAAVGYNSVRRDLKSNLDQTIILSPSTRELSEVVVTSMGKARQKKEAGFIDGKVSGLSVHDASDPVTGRENFNQYLRDSIKIPQALNGQLYKGAVILSFKTKKNGEPEKIRVERSLCDACNKEAIRLLQAGPKWKYLKNKRTTISINF